VSERKDDGTTLDPDLRGNTLRVYWLMLSQSEPVGVREVQRALGMSSPSVASHHLTKLVSLELVEKLPDNSYEVSRVVKVGVLRNFIGFRGMFLPRYMFVAIFFTVSTIAYLAISLMNPRPGLYDKHIALAIGSVGALFAWWETFRLWKLKLS
jgi:DNA-binding transcriptional ArsR family regulator